MYVSRYMPTSGPTPTATTKTHTHTHLLKLLVLNNSYFFVGIYKRLRSGIGCLLLLPV